MDEDPAGRGAGHHDLTVIRPATEDRVNELWPDYGPPPDDWYLIGQIGDEIVETFDLAETAPAPSPTPLTDRFPDPVRGVLAEKVVIVTTLDPYLSLEELEKYSGYGLRTLRSFLKGQNVLPHYRIEYGKILVRVSDWDAFIAPHRHTKGRMEEIVDERRRLRAGRRRPRGR
jgi:hypothetical protein